MDSISILINITLIAYLSIGEASSFRSYWKPEWGEERKETLTITDLAPEWMGTVANPDWLESVKVRYWNSEWQTYMLDELKKFKKLDLKGCI